MLLIRHSYIKLVHLSCETIIAFALFASLISPGRLQTQLPGEIKELTEPCRLSAWYRPLFHFAYTFVHILPNATLAFAVLVINTHCSGETASRVDGCIKQISICPLCLVWVRAPRWQHVRQANLCLRVCQVSFSRQSPVFAHLLIGP